MSAGSTPIPVILDTDIGTDIDDTWALAFMLRCPELDVRLIVAGTRNTTYRAKIIARLLEAAGRTDIPVGVGIHFASSMEPYLAGVDNQVEWVHDYRLEDYPGTVHYDGVQAIIDTIMASDHPVTLICIGPLPDIGEALEREPRIVARARFVGMHGSIYGHGRRGAVRAREPNVRNHTTACQRVFRAAWDVTITPLDTCGLIRLDGARYRAVRDCHSPLTRAVIENYRLWVPHFCPPRGLTCDPDTASAGLCDTAAIYAAFSQDFLVMKTLGVHVTDAGYTIVDPAAKRIHCALEWRDLDAFEDLLAQRLAQE